MSKQIGTKPYQTPRNADLGTLAYIDNDAVGELRAEKLYAGNVLHTDTEDYNLTVSRTAGGNGVLKLYGDNYYAGNPHMRWQLEPTSGATLKNGLMTFDGTHIKASAFKIDTSLGEDHVNGVPSMEIYHYNYPDDNTTNVAAMKIKVGNNSSDLIHHGFLSLEQIFTGNTYESPYLWFRNNANSSNDKALIGINLGTGTAPSLKFTYDLIGSSENYVDIDQTKGSKTFAGLNPSGLRIGSDSISSGNFYANAGSYVKYGLLLDRDVSGEDSVPVIRMVSSYDSGTETNSEIYVTSAGTNYDVLNSSRKHMFRAQHGVEFDITNGSYGGAFTNSGAQRGSYSHCIGTFSPHGNAKTGYTNTKYIHILIQYPGSGCMFRYNLTGYDYNTSTKYWDDIVYGYHYANNPLYSGGIVNPQGTSGVPHVSNMYWINSSQAEMVVNTTHSGATNHWGSFHLFGGIDGITTYDRPIRCVGYAITDSATQVF